MVVCLRWWVCVSNVYLVRVEEERYREVGYIKLWWKVFIEGIWKNIGWGSVNVLNVFVSFKVLWRGVVEMKEDEIELGVWFYDEKLELKFLGNDFWRLVCLRRFFGKCGDRLMILCFFMKKGVMYVCGKMCLGKIICMFIRLVIVLMKFYWFSWKELGGVIWCELMYDVFVFFDFGGIFEVFYVCKR